jgi:hypothetical protein
LFVAKPVPDQLIQFLCNVSNLFVFALRVNRLLMNGALPATGSNTKFGNLFHNFIKKIMETYDTVVAALNGLRKKGYTLDFNLAFDKLVCQQNELCLNPSEFEITEMYRFEGATNPSDEDVVYAVAAKDGHLKGVITSAFGTYADSLSTEMIKKLTMNTH